MTTCATEYEAPHQTSEPWPFLVTHRGQPVTVGVEACVLPDRQDVTEGDWLPAIVALEADGTTTTNVLVSGLQPGWHRVWARARGAVHRLGSIHLT